MASQTDTAYRGLNGNCNHMANCPGTVDIQCSQINLHRSPTANISVNEWMAGRTMQTSQTRAKVALVQEPHNTMGKITNISKNLKVFTGKTNQNIRASIITTPDVEAWLLGQFSNEDQVAIAFKSGNKIITMASTYMPYDSQEAPPPQITRDLISFCLQKGWGLVIGADANSHNEVWGSSDTNNRGDELLNYLSTTQMHICNQGNTPTFSNRIREEVIDITIASNNLIENITNWRVSNKETFSDHSRIEFQLTCSLLRHQSEFRNVRKTDWIKYNDQIKQTLPEMEEFKNKTLEEMNHIIENVIRTAFTDNCKTSKSLKIDKPVWWSLTLTTLKRKAERMKQKSRRNPTDLNLEQCKAAVKQYRKEIKKAKKESWENYCSGLESLSATARLQRIMRMNHKSGINTIRKADGSHTTSPEETLEELMRILFPDAQQGSSQHQNPATPIIPTSNRALDIESITNSSAIKAAIKSFQPYKSPGVDGIYPALLQEGLETLNPYLQILYRQSLKEGKIPRNWTEIRAVFIPKPGREDYSDPKSYRPISLSSFLLKGLERLVHWHLIGTNLKSQPLQPNLYSYQEGKSTENALHRVIHRVERALEQNNFVIVIFLDISGAFSDASIEGMLNTMRKRDIEPKLLEWISYVLKNRKVTANMLGSEVSKILNRGTPQGGILSPTIWNFEMNDCLEIIPKNGPTEGHAFADDTNLLSTGIDEQTIADNLQKDLKSLERWASENTLSFNPEKSKVMIFSRKINYKEPKLVLNGKELQYVNEYKYLGITIDRKLSWKSHIRTQVKKATRILLTARRMIGTRWGLSPKQMMWIYKGIVLPTITYGALVWIQGLQKKNIQQELTRLQRKACLMITRGMQSTPTAGMEAILGLPPVHLWVQGIAIKSYSRLETAGQWGPKTGEKLWKHSHTKIMEGLLKELKDINQPSGRLTCKERVQTTFQINILKRTEVEKFRPKPTTEDKINCFTDGSKMPEGCGAGYMLMGENIKIYNTIPLGKNSTVFQAEVIAIAESCKDLARMNLKNKHIDFYIDNQSAIKAIDNYIIKDKVVLEAKLAIKTLTVYNTVTLNWIPGHEGHLGNEIADQLGKRASNTMVLGPEPSIPVQHSLKAALVENWCMSKHQDWWNTKQDCRQTKMNPKVGKNGKEFLKLTMQQSRIATQLLTGHANLMRHRYLMKLEDTPICEKCEEEEETAFHFLAECPAYGSIRHITLGSSILKESDIQNISLRKLLLFTTQSNRWRE